MKVTEDSICLRCEHFWHECGDQMQQVEYACFEKCSNPDVSIQDKFENECVVNECAGFILEI